jgi:hypothetical protein
MSGRFAAPAAIAAQRIVVARFPLKCNDRARLGRGPGLGFKSRAYLEAGAASQYEIRGV